MPQWLEHLGAALPAQLRAYVLTGVNVGMWFAIVAVCNARQGNVTRWNVYGGIGMMLTLLGFTALDNGQLWFGLEVLLGLLACLGFLFELRALRELKSRFGTENPPQP